MTPIAAVHTAFTSATVETQAGTITVLAGIEQYPTQDLGLTAPRPMVTLNIPLKQKRGDATHREIRIAAAEAETFGRAVMFAAVEATDMAEVNG